jgi:hypothetical protein
LEATTDYGAVLTKEAYEELIDRLYLKVSRGPSEIVVPPVKIIAVEGNQPPGSHEFQIAIATIYDISFALKGLLKFKRVRQPQGYFDYKAGSLEALWTSESGGKVDLDDPETLRWKVFLMVPAFVTDEMVGLAAVQARENHPENVYAPARLEILDEGNCVQVVHVGPHDEEAPAREKLHLYCAEHGLEEAGPQHDVYISDENLTAPSRLETVIRYPVRPIGQGAAAAS